ncbi:hypothetical protein BH09VER1_BH09VER1_28540 [soil metagenome]
MGDRIVNYGGGPITISGGNVISFVAGMTIDKDGSPRAYHPKGSPPGADFLANAGHPGSWWGLACDSQGHPIIQSAKDPAPGFYVSTTSYKHRGFPNGDPRRELNSDEVPFIVIPSPLIREVRGVLLGARAVILTPDGHPIACVVGDIGPKAHLGEASAQAARLCGVDSNPKTGGSSRRFTYTIYADVPAPGFELKPALHTETVTAIAQIADFKYVK